MKMIILCSSMCNPFGTRRSRFVPEIRMKRMTRRWYSLCFFLEGGQSYRGPLVYDTMYIGNEVAHWNWRNFGSAS